MRIYRVEREGIGPYQNMWTNEEKRWDMMSDHCDDRHPSPYRDSLLGDISHKEVCGFSNLPALYEWFDGYLSELAESEFVIALYESDIYREGEYNQVVFDRESKRVGEIPWNLPAIDA